MPLETRVSGELMPEEIEDAEIQITRKAQREVFRDEYLGLSPIAELPQNSKLLKFVLSWMIMELYDLMDG